MPPNQAILSKKFEELESELHLLKHLKQHHHLLPSIRSKLSFLTSLLAAEPIFSSPELSTRLSHIASQISSFDQPNSQPKIPPLSPEEEGEKETSVAARIAAVEEVFARLVSTDDTPPSCSRTTSSSGHTEEAEEEEEVVGSRAPWLLSLRSKIEDLEQEINGDGYDDAQRKIRFFKSLLAAEMKWKGGEKVNDFDSIVKRFSSIETEFAGRNRNVESFACSSASSCFDEVREEEKVEEEGDGSVVSGVNEIGECCLLESLELVGVDLESDDSEKGIEKGIGGGRRFGKLGALGAMVGVLAVVAAGVVIGNFYGEVNHVYLVPT